MSEQKLVDRTERARRAYLESRVRGADPQALLVMLYEGLLQSLQLGERSLREQDWATAQESLSRARRIVTYLLTSLRKEGGQISDHLQRLYVFCFENIGRANLERRPELLPAVIKVVRELSGAWQVIAGQGAATGGEEEGG
ncbi:MAG: flagellar export chaperone FliS [Candidatus Krumholzibacteriota bacterium]|nr:flagellar export chaperone FliS [Candidatus Krumholzibacteriota bacterium]